MSFIVKIKKQLALYELTVDLETEAGILAVIGGSGSGKTRFHIKPNLMQMNVSFIVTDI